MFGSRGRDVSVSAREQLLEPGFLKRLDDNKDKHKKCCKVVSKEGKAKETKAIFGTRL